MGWIAGKAVEKAKAYSLDCLILDKLDDGVMCWLRLSTLFAAIITLGAVEPAVVTRVVPQGEALDLRSTGKLNLKAVPECSALLASAKHPGVFWTLSDSGRRPEVVPVFADGGLANGRGGVTLVGAKNFDWEALTADGEGNLIVADVGNNISTRKELSFYIFKEPDLFTKEANEVRKVSFAWPDQVAFPDPDLSHDCEAAFFANGRIYLLTKHRRDTLTDLWCAEITPEGKQANLRKVARFDAQGMVTDASISPDGKALAILTYRNIWVFRLPAKGEDFFNGPALFTLINPPVQSWQLEGCAWLNDHTLIVGSEQGDLYTIPLARLAEVK